MKIKPRQLPARIATGAFMLNSGIGKLSANEEAAASVHGFATGTYPFLGKFKPKDFARLLGATEIVLGTALIVPVVPEALAGAALAAYSGGLLGLYARTPGMRKPGTPLPTEQGIVLAKDSWLMGIALSLIIDGLTD
jgi:uncharacterized membrane protein YphA (DoxX/SURF4 family)